MALEIASALLPVFFVMGLGYAAGRRGVVDNSDVSSLNQLLMLIALPISLFTAMATTSRTVIADNWWLGVVLAVVLLLTFAAVYAMQRRVFALPSGEAAVQALGASFPNFAAVGLPLTGAVLGPSATLAVAVAIAVGAVTVSPLTITILENDQARRLGTPGTVSHRLAGALGAAVRKPIFLGPVAGLAWSAAGLPVSDLASGTLQQIGGVSAGVALFLTGLILSAQPLRLDGNVAVSTVVKNVLQPLLCLLVVLALQVPDPYATQALLLSAIPSGFFGLLFGLGYGLRPAVAGSTVVASSLASTLTLSVAIALISA